MEFQREPGRFFNTDWDGRLMAEVTFQDMMTVTRGRLTIRLLTKACAVKGLPAS